MEKATPGSEWITVKEMQRMLSIGKTKAYAILREEDIDAASIGTAIRVNRASLDRWLTEQRYPEWRADPPARDRGG